jgi:hypothetical protein
MPVVLNTDLKELFLPKLYRRRESGRCQSSGVTWWNQFFSQYCGHSSAAGVTRYLKFHEPLLVNPVDCAAAKDNGGNITINGKVFTARIGSRTSHSFFVAGSLDARHNCQTGTVTYGNAVIDYQSTQSVLEILLMEEFGKVNDMTGTIKLPGNSS